MFYAKQFKSLLDAVKQLDPDAEVVPSLLRITFKLPNVGKCVLEYAHQGFDDEYDAVGTIKLSYGDRTTEFDSLQYALDGVEGLSRMPADDDDAERAYGDWADTAMMDHYDSMNGDIGDFESVARNICEKAGQKALAEAIGALYNACHPMTEAAEKVHTVPEEMARAVNDYIADTDYTHPETREQLRASELEGNWNWLDEEADELIPIWNDTHSGEKVWQARCDIEERGMPL